MEFPPLRNFESGEPPERRHAADSIKRRALARLYERRSAVDNLISALETLPARTEPTECVASQPWRCGDVCRKIAPRSRISPAPPDRDFQFTHQACTVRVYCLGADLQEIGDIFGA